MSFELARRIADAVLYEGYMHLPCNASSAKNRCRWQFGVVAPREWSEAGGDPWADMLPARQTINPGLIGHGHTIPVARVQAMHEGKRRARSRRDAGPR